jgi:FtsZ-interacting cell division protein ZipA
VNSLQIGLIAVGALVVAVLFFWQWWQSRRAERSITAAASTATDLRALTVTPPPAAVEVIPAERVEPVFNAHPPADWVAAPVDWRADELMPTTAPPVPAPVPAPVPPAAVNNIAVAKPSALQPPVPVSPPPVPASPPPPPPSTDRVPPVVPKLRSEWPFDERLHVHASVVSNTGTPFDAAPFVMAAGRAIGWVRLFRQSPWESFDAAQVGSVQQLVLALPLASRQGPIEAQDMDAWQFVLSELSTSLGCEIHFNGFRDAPQRAAELDSFLAAVDIMPDVYLIKKDGGHWTGTRLRGTLEANGFRLQSDGRFAYHEVESEAVIFHAVDGFERPFTPERLRTEAITALRFSIEPVRLAHPLARYDTFRQSLRALSKLLDADLKSGEGELLDDQRFATMRDEVKTAMDAIVGAGIEPGSDTARSLFS